MSVPTPHFDASQRRRLLGLTLAALVVRLLFLALEPETRPTGDERTWIGWGTQSPAGVASPEVRFSPLRTGVLFYPPLYPYFIGAAFALGGGLTAVQIAQVVVGSLLVPIVGALGARVAGPRAGLVAAAAVAFYPDLVWFSVHFWSETLFLVLLWTAFERLFAADDARRATQATLAGLLWGLAILTRETTLYFTPLAALWLAWRAPRPERRAAVARGALFLLTALLTVAPWTWRNWIVHRAFIPVSTAGGLNLWQGNAPLTRQEVYDRYQAVTGLVEQYRHARRMGLEAIWARQPAWLLEKLRDELPLFFEADSLALVHIRRGAYGEVARGPTLAAAALVLLPYLALLALFVVACGRVPLDRRVVLLLSFLAYYAAIHVATHGFARYRLPALPVLVVLAAAGLSLGERRAPSTPRRRLATALVALTLLASVAPSLREWLAFAAGAPSSADEGGAVGP
jgi:4-amino-4-deoxy-L-arabinose transferase-like glycosyltransferase